MNDTIKENFCNPKHTFLTVSEFLWYKVLNYERFPY